jgi:hypothetical protein
MDTKRQNKLLKLAIGKLQEELEERPGKPTSDDEEENTNTFLTEGKIGARTEEKRKEKLLEAMKKEMPEYSEFLAAEASHIEGTTA